MAAEESYLEIRSTLRAGAKQRQVSPSPAAPAVQLRDDQRCAREECANFRRSIVSDSPGPSRIERIGRLGNVRARAGVR